MPVPLAQVPFANHPRGIPRIAKGVRDGPLVAQHAGGGVDRRTDLRAVLPRIASSEQRAARRRADWLDVELRQLHALPRDPVHAGGGYVRAAVESRLAPAHVVRQEHQDVGPGNAVAPGGAHGRIAIGASRCVRPHRSGRLRVREGVQEQPGEDHRTQPAAPPADVRGARLSPGSGRRFPPRFWRRFPHASFSRPAGLRPALRSLCSPRSEADPAPLPRVSLQTRANGHAERRIADEPLPVTVPRNPARLHN